jgi:hypothetical protein
MPSPLPMARRENRFETPKHNPKGQYASTEACIRRERIFRRRFAGWAGGNEVRPRKAVSALHFLLHLSGKLP